MVHFLIPLCILSALLEASVTGAASPSMEDYERRHSRYRGADKYVYQQSCKPGGCGWKSLDCINNVCDFKPGLDGSEYLGKGCNSRKECGNAGLDCEYDKSRKRALKKKVGKCSFAVPGSDLSLKGKPCDSRGSSSGQCGLNFLYCINDKCSYTKGR